jgi:biotin carboxyl carrier protein
MQHAFKLEDSEYDVGLSRSATDYRLHCGGEAIPLLLHERDDGTALLTVGGISRRVIIAARGDDVFVHIDGAAYQLRYQHPLARFAQAGAGSGADSVLAPMPGSLVALHVAAGATVARGQALLVMESMKMETTIVAPRDGVVQEVRFAPGQTFDRDALLLVLEPAGESA